MKLNFTKTPESYRPHIVEVGNLYMNLFGDYWLVVAITPSENCFVLRYDEYDEYGDILGACRYAPHYIAGKKLVGKVELPTLDVMWEGKSI